MEDCPYTGCAQNKERKQNSANTPLQWLDWPQTTAKIVIQSVSDTAEKKTFSGRENRAWPAWSLVTRWTEPARSWGCASSKSDVYRSGDGSSRTSNGSNRRLLVLPTKYIAGAKDKGLRLEPETGTKPFGRPDHVTSRVRMGDERSHLISRQPGSIFKPILYARALEDGYSPYYMVEDEIRTFVTNTRGEQWTPTNSGGGASGRLVTLEQGLAWSKNTVSAHLINKIGPQDVIDLAQDMDVSSPMMPVPSLALGTSETSLLEMVNAYATIADYGVRRNVTAITSISDKEGHIVATFPSEPDRVLSEQTSYTMINMLRKAVDQGTGGWLRTRFGIQGDVAGKTGTTQNNADGWFVAMHPDAVVGAWVGFNDQPVTFTSDYWGQGGHNALLLVGDFLQSGSKGPAAYISSSEFKRPAAYQNPKKPLYSAPPKHIDLAAIGGELREPFEDESFTAPARSQQSISTFTRRARIRTLSTPPDRGQ